MRRRLERLFPVDARRLLWLVPILIFLYCGFRAVSQAGYFASEVTDFTVYFAAAVALTHGHDPYQIVSARGWHFISPVFTAIVLTPLTGLSVMLAAAVWYVLSLAFLIATLMLAFNRLAPERKLREYKPALWIVPLVILAGPIIVTLSRGQWFLFIAFLITLAWWCHDTGREFWSGFSFGVAAALKVLPFLFLFYLLVKRRWIAVIGFAAAVFCGVVLLPGVFVRWSAIPGLHREWLHMVAYPAVTGSHSVVSGELLDLRLKRNQAIAAVVFRVVTRFVQADIRVAQAVTLTLDATVVIAAAIVLIRRRVERSPESAAVEIGLMSAAMLCVAPVAWSHYEVVLLLPLLLLTSVALKEIRAPISSTAASAILALMFAIAVIHELSANAQIFGAWLLNNSIVFGWCWYWLWTAPHSPQRPAVSRNEVNSREQSDRGLRRLILPR